MEQNDNKASRQELIQLILFRAGIALLIIAPCLGLGELLGLFKMPEVFLMGESPLKTYARIAVLGCVAAAIGSWNPVHHEYKNLTQPMRQKPKE